MVDRSLVRSASKLGVAKPALERSHDIPALGEPSVILQFLEFRDLDCRSILGCSECDSCLGLNEDPAEFGAGFEPLLPSRTGFVDRLRQGRLRSLELTRLEQCIPELDEMLESNRVRSRQQIDRASEERDGRRSVPALVRTVTRMAE